MEVGGECVFLGTIPSSGKRKEEREGGKEEGREERRRGEERREGKGEERRGAKPSLLILSNTRTENGT